MRRVDSVGKKMLAHCDGKGAPIMAERGYFAAEAKCPYFLGEGKKSQCVICSGLEQGQTVRLFFRSNKRREAWLWEKCCSWEYCKCPMHCAIEQQQGE